MPFCLRYSAKVAHVPWIPGSTPPACSMGSCHMWSIQPTNQPASHCLVSPGQDFPGSMSDRRCNRDWRPLVAGPAKRLHLRQMSTARITTWSGACHIDLYRADLAPHSEQE
ncbi:hypothetical protein BO78DRAFT_239655 [Aspergillus sclerotiicarbonarius CBS 121057]|uniref:Uncharacterized protein n=1 Tax=Aspergillus sclerotiicarbonarius (strain CBS 121057 / IBT 28362) TaxID=1448318 RepID=A0A319E5Q6_ASPSB|nr:hypothetical protein BO78DRAFT_239655 [Aspergillus sclerotiicarbonarius CBS 121057]